MAWTMQAGTDNFHIWLPQEISLLRGGTMNQQSSSTNPLRRIYTGRFLAERKLAGLWLALLSFAEASFFPFSDVLLIPLCLGKWKSFSLRINMLNRLRFGRTCGYAIGAFAWDTLANWFYDFIPGFTPEKFDRIRIWYDEWVGFLFFWRDFLPFPIKFSPLQWCSWHGSLAVSFGFCS